MADLVLDTGRHPDRLLRRHHPGARRRRHLHDAGIGIEKLAPPMVVPWPQRRADVVDGIGRDRPAGIVQIARMRLQRAALRPLSFPTALSVAPPHMTFYGKTGNDGP